MIATFAIAVLILSGTQNTFAQTAENSKYYLIAGSFHTFESSQEALEELEDEGFQPVILFPKNDEKKLYRVSIYQANKRNEVSKYQALLKGQGRKAGWIYEAKEGAGTSGSISKVASIPDTATAMHYLIVASLKGYNEALQSASELNEKGFESELLFPEKDGGMYRVSVYNATDREEIEAYATMLKRQGREKGWIHTIPIDGSTPTVIPAPSVSRSAGPATTDASLRYHLIAGSYDNYMVALDFSEDMKAKGYHALVIFPDEPTGNYRVSIYHADNRSEVSAFNQAQKKQGKKHGWVLDRGE